MKQYDPKKIVIAFAGNLLTGFADGTFVSAKKSTDAFSTAVGADGEVVRIKSNDETGEVTITLLGSSASNDLLSALHAADLLSGVGVAPLMIKDLFGTTLLSSQESWLKKFSDVEYGKELGGREWVIACKKLIMNVGGSL